MKKNISSKGITEEEVKKWVASITKDEWRKKLEEEKYLYELNKVKNSDWLSFKYDISVEFVESTSEDKRRFTWTRSVMPSNNLETVSCREFFNDVEAA